MLFLKQICLILGILCETTLSPMITDIVYEEVLSHHHKHAYMKAIGQEDEEAVVSDELFQKIIDKRIATGSSTLIFYDTSKPERTPVGIGSYTAEVKLSRGGVVKIHIRDIVVSKDYKTSDLKFIIVKLIQKVVIERFKDGYKIVAFCGRDEIEKYACIGYENEGAAMKINMLIPEVNYSELSVSKKDKYVNK